MTPLNPNQVIDRITQAMSELSALKISDTTLGGLAYTHLADARKLLVAKYQPNSEEIGN